MDIQRKHIKRAVREVPLEPPVFVRPAPKEVSSVRIAPPVMYGVAFEQVAPPVFPPSGVTPPTPPQTPIQPPTWTEGAYPLGEEVVWLVEEPVVPEPLVSAVPFEPAVFASAQKQKKAWVKSLVQRLWSQRSMPTTWAQRGKKVALVGGLLCLVYGGYLVLMRGYIEGRVTTGMQAAQSGVKALQQEDFRQAERSFIVAEDAFRDAKRATLYFPVSVARPLAKIPGIKRGAAGFLAVDTGQHFSRAAQSGVAILRRLALLKATGGDNVSYLAALSDVATPLTLLRQELEASEGSLRAIPIEAVPAAQQKEVALLQENLPGIIGGLASFEKNQPMFQELLGGNGPRLYLFLFQNNQEIRPTGGFIGTYGLLEFKQGHVKRFFIDGIFNPDGQLKENIVPPKPIQKMSAGWSLHDSNWFPNFPTSAEKAIFFYEKTGGPTVDGVFTLTPTVMERLLALTGPIELPEYEITVDEKNFIPTIQEQVEVKYDKVENKPKKVLADLASTLMERVFATSDPVTLYKMAGIFVDGLNQQQMLLYTRNQDTEKLITDAGWSGKIQETPRDYLSVINTNVNGFKTDGIIDDTITHTATIADDGSVVVTTKITRTHKGGNTPYDWWNRVNSNYMRVYVPLGSQLLSAMGQTREFPPEPLDYNALGFKRDKDVVAEEQNIHIDDATGTRIGEEFGKTVFGNWVYVSPGESVAVEYTYMLPFTVDPKQRTGGYSLLLQKQPGSRDIDFTGAVQYPADWQTVWQSDQDLLPWQELPGEKKVQQRLRNNLFYGLVFDQQ